MTEPRRLSLVRCRKLMGDKGEMSDTEVAAIRDRVYLMVEGLFEAYKYFQAPSSRIDVVTTEDLQNHKLLAAHATRLEDEHGFPRKYAELEAIESYFSAKTARLESGGPLKKATRRRPRRDS